VGEKLVSRLCFKRDLKFVPRRDEEAERCRNVTFVTCDEGRQWSNSSGGEGWIKKVTQAEGMRRQSELTVENHHRLTHLYQLPIFTH
jgi:hypothetical protein